ncbi:hypothetical protein QYF61_011421, partial [Mycteria americana]
MGKYLGQWAPPMFWNFTPEQVQDPEKLGKYLEVCCHLGNSRETQITATCWGLAHAYQALFNTIQYPQGEEKVSGSDDKTTGTPTLATGTVATPTVATGTAATPTPVTGIAAEPGNQPMLVSAAPIHKKKSWKQKSARLVRDDEKAGPSQEEQEEELINKTVTIRSLSLSELQDMGIDKAVGKGAQVLSLWRRLLSGVKERHTFKEDVICHPGKWTTMERGIQYLRELAMLEVIYSDLDNKQLSKGPDEVKCTRPMWRKFVRSAPSSYTNSLAILTWKDREEPTVDELSQKVQQLEEDMSYSPPIQTSISAIR